MSFPRYPEYNQSGVEWLGQVPKHWQVDRLKRSIQSCKNGVWGDEALGDENDIPCVRVADFNRQRLISVLVDPTIRNVPEKDRSSRLLVRGNLLLEKSGGGEKQPVGCVVLYDDIKSAVCSNFIARVEVAHEMDSSFWRYVHAAAYAIRLTTCSINQTSGIQNLDQERYFNERVVFPPFAEQVAIAAFLDRETSKIDELITVQKRLIELLKEKRMAIIFHAVTKGINQSVRMKDSNIEWLGRVPEHWNLNRIKSLFDVKKRISGVEGYDVLSITQQGIKVKDIESGDGQLSMDYSKYQFVEVGDFAMNHMDLLTGYVDISNFYGVTSPDYRVFSIKNKEKCFDKYYLYLFQMGYKNKIFFAYGQGSSQLGRWRFPTDQFNNFIFPQPPLHEQVEISSFLNSEITKIDSLFNETNRAIELLQERCTALISAAVTGKIDVRGLA